MTSFRLSTEERNALGERMRAARYVSGRSLRDVAAHLDVSVNAVMQWEHGSLPAAPEARAKLAALYGVDESTLFAEYEARMEAARDLLRPA